MIMDSQKSRPKSPTAPGSRSLVGNKVPTPHRFHLSNGTVLTGDIHRSPGSRLADHLSTMKGYVSVTNVVCDETGKRIPYIVINSDHILFIEELAPPGEDHSPSHDEAALRHLRAPKQTWTRTELV